MVDEERDEALSWDGDDDRAPRPASSRAHGSLAAPSARQPKAADAVGARAEATGLGNVALVTLGLLGGIYVLWSVGWIVSGLRVLPIATGGPPNGLGVDGIGYRITMWLAVLAPPIWFGTVYYLTRSSRTWLRFVLLIAGAIVLLPWPFLMLGTVGR